MLSNYLLEYLITGTRGGPVRARIIEMLSKHPQNMHRLAGSLDLDYKTVQHHIRVLMENNAISAVHKGSYGALYHLSPDMQESMKEFRRLLR